MSEVNIFDPEVVWETATAQVQRMEDQENTYRLGRYNRNIDNYNRDWGTNPNPPNPPPQEEKVALILHRKEQANENGLTRLEGPELLGEKYVSPNPDRLPGTVTYGPFAPEFSHGSQRVHNDSNSNVSVGHVDIRPDGQKYTLVAHDNGRLFWYPVV